MQHADVTGIPSIESFCTPADKLYIENFPLLVELPFEGLPKRVQVSIENTAFLKSNGG